MSDQSPVPEPAQATEPGTDPSKPERQKSESSALESHWKAILQETLKRFPECLEPPTTFSGIPVELVHSPLDLAEHDYTRDLGFPGEYPYTRGIYPPQPSMRLITDVFAYCQATPREAMKELLSE